jgi:6-phosphogluconolactonase
MRFLGIDYGDKRTGLAVSDADATLANPLTVIETENPIYLAERIAHIMAEHAVDAVVLGLPLNMDGREGPRAQRVRTFAELLSALISKPIEFYDERLSSYAAESLFPAGQLTRGQKKKRRDAVAASVILQSFLDERRQNIKPSACPRLVRFASPRALARRAAEEFIAAAKEAAAQHGRFYAAISGGKTPRLFFEHLAQPEFAEQVPWDKTFIFWADERCVPPNSPHSNYALARETFLKAVPIPPEQIFRVHGEYDDCVKAADVYQTILRNVFGCSEGTVPVFDLIVLGLGQDGHIASLLPNDPALSVTDDLTWPVFTESNFNRVTLTPPVLQNARRLMVLVEGKEKAPILRDLFTGSPDPHRYPAYLLWPVLEKVRWLIDQDAAALLPQTVLNNTEQHE